MLSCVFCGIFQNNCFAEHPRVTGGNLVATAYLLHLKQTFYSTDFLKKAERSLTYLISCFFGDSLSRW